ncbi:mbre tpr repeat protein [Stylonychia lemnae]|uniref:Mbre tpr repeat protein n=1 Tax=Stylonychia lemnae TaxID=5949 RepID=A0A078AVE2_STYLE|nr:mbre tpr repeat protein [Stylonychia lemnae]|eukprot:CDW86149.1 mbre tpr repeat protein [Stylonychia lemnae]
MGNNNSCCCNKRDNQQNENQSGFSDNPNFNLEKKVYQSPRGNNDNTNEMSNYNTLKSKINEFKLRFNQKFLSGQGSQKNLNSANLETGSTQSNAKSYVNNNRQRHMFTPNKDGMVSEIMDEDLNNSNDEEVRRKRQLLCSINISALTPCYQEGHEDIFEYETLSSSNLYINGKLLLIFSEYVAPRSTPNHEAPQINFDQSHRLPTIQPNNAKRVLINSKIYDLFHPTHGDYLFDIVGVNQNIVIQPMEIHKEEEQVQFENSYIKETKLLEKVVGLLKNTVSYQKIDKIQLQYETETSYTFKINQTGYENIKLKIPKDPKYVNINELGILEDLFFEAQLQKLLYEQSYINEVKEEVIMINALDQSVSDYLVVIEEPDLSLHDLYHSIKDPRDNSIISQGLWFNNKKEHFSVTKYLLYLFKALQTIQYLHKNGIVLSGIRPDEILIDRSTQNVKFKNFLYSSVLTKGGKPILAQQLAMGSNANDSSRIDTSRTEEVENEFADINGEFNIFMKNNDHFKLKRYDEKYSATNEVRDVFNKNFKKEIFKFNKKYVHSLFLQTQNYSEQTIKFNDIASIIQCFKLSNIQELISCEILNKAEQMIISLIEKEILVDSTIYFKNKQILKIMIKRLKKFVFSNPEVLNYLIDQSVLEGNYSFALQLCTVTLDKQTQNKYGIFTALNTEDNQITVQEKLIEYHLKRAKIYRLMKYHQKTAIKDIKQALFIINMHFQEKIELKTMLMMDMVELLIEVNDLNDAIIKLQSVEQQIKNSSTNPGEKNLQSNANLLLKYNDIRAKIYELKKDKQRKLTVDQESYQLCLGISNGDYKNYRVQDYQERIITTQIQKGSYEEAKSSINKYQQNCVGLYGDNSVQSIQQHLFRGQIEQSKQNEDEALNYFTSYLDMIREYYPEQTIQRANLYDRIGFVLSDKKFFQKAQNYYERSLNIKLYIFGENNEQTAISFNYLGSLLQNQNLNQQALEYLMKALNIHLKLNQNNETYPMHQLYYQIALAHKSSKNYEKSTFYLEKTLIIMNQPQNKHSVNQTFLAEVYNDLGMIYKLKQEHLKAINNLKDCLKIKKKILNNQSNEQSLSYLYQSLASLYLSIKKYERSLEYTQQEIQVLTHHFGSQHQSLATPLYRVGTIYYSIGNQDKALISLKEARQILKANISLNSANSSVNKISPEQRRMSTSSMSGAQGERDLLFRVEQLIGECNGGKNTQFARVRSNTQKDSTSQSPSKLNIFST